MGVGKGGFPRCVSFVTKDGNQTFEEIGDGIQTVVQTKENLYRKAVIIKLDKKKEIYKILFRRGVYANTDTIVYAAFDQEWAVDEDEIRQTNELKTGDRLVRVEPMGPLWEVVEIEPMEGEYDMWSVKVHNKDSFCLRNVIPTMSLEVSDE